MVIWLVAAVLATSSQFVPNPVARLLVCICTRQPVWSDGHESVRWFATIPIARLGPFVETKIDPNELSIQLFQNGQLRQNSNTRQLIFKPAELVSFISTNLTLLPGDVILTGTTSGVGPIQSGDKLEVRIQGLAPLNNSVR